MEGNDIATCEAEIVNMLGVRTAVTLRLDYRERWVQVGQGARVPVDALTWKLSRTAQTRLDLAYEDANRAGAQGNLESSSLTTSAGRHVLQKAMSSKLADQPKSQGQRRRLSVMFPSSAARERFAGRLRLVQQGRSRDFLLRSDDSRVPGSPASFANRASSAPPDIVTSKLDWLKVCCATFNAGDRGPPETALLAKWLPPGDFDVYAVRCTARVPKQGVPS